MEKVVIVGATSGIGRELAKVMSGNGYAVGIAGRRKELLVEAKEDLPGEAYLRQVDVCRPTEAVKVLEDLVREMGGMDILVICSGVCLDNPKLDWDKEKYTIDVNVAGFAALAGAAFSYFAARGSGHIVGISSVRGIRGGGSAPAYNASKAFVSNYLEGLRVRAKKMNVNVLVTDIRPGFVETAMTSGRKNGLFMSTVDAASRQIFSAIVRRRRRAYITRRWTLIACLLRNMPDRVYQWI